FEMNGLRHPMSSRAKSFMLFTALAMTAAWPAAAQVRTGLATPVQMRPAAAPAKPAGTAVKAPAAKPAKPTKPESAATGAPVPGNPDFKPDQAQAAPAPLPPPLPPAVWDLVSAQDLLNTIEQIGKEGLNPADYDPAGLAAAIKTGDPLVVSKEATDRFDRLSSDLARSEEHTSELQSPYDIVCRLLLEKKKLSSSDDESILFT